MATPKRIWAGSHPHGDGTLSEAEDVASRLGRLMEEHKELRRRTAYLKQTMHRPATAPLVTQEYNGPSYEEWAISKDQERAERIAREREERALEQQRAREAEQTKITHDLEQQQKRDASFQRFLERIHDTKRRHEAEQQTVRQFELRKEQDESARKARGVAAYERWLATHHVSRRQERPRSMSPRHPSLANKHISYDDWVASLELRPASKPYCNPREWVDPEVPNIPAEDAVADSLPLQYPATTKHKRERLKKTTDLPTTAVKAQRQQLAGVSESAGALLLYQDPSPPLLWRDRELRIRTDLLC